MATATQDVDGSLHLDLSLEEAAVLLFVYNKVGGHPDTSPRGRFDSVIKALREATGEHGHGLLQAVADRYYCIEYSGIKPINQLIYFGPY